MEERFPLLNRSRQPQSYHLLLGCLRNSPDDLSVCRARAVVDLHCEEFVSCCLLVAIEPESFFIFTGYHDVVTRLHHVSADYLHAKRDGDDCH
jgi:hypothetical protein